MVIIVEENVLNYKNKIKIYLKIGGKRKKSYKK